MIAGMLRRKEKVNASSFFMPRRSAVPMVAPLLLMLENRENICANPMIAA